MMYPSRPVGSHVLGFVVAAVLAGCGDPGERFFIVQNQVPQNGCVISGDRAAPYRGSGRMDVALVSANAQTGYRLFPLLQNDLPAMGQAGGTEPNRLSLREFRVHLEPAPGSPQALVDLFATTDPDLARQFAYSQPWSGTLEPGGSTLAAGVTVVSAEVARRIDATGVLDTYSSVGLTARVRAVGDTLDDTVESREFVYPISACKFCLVSYMATCPYVPVNTGNACNVAQDDPVDCCSDGSSLECPARGPTGTTTTTTTTTTTN